MTEEHAETDLERSERNLNELLQELRIALPGVQVLFAFLLAVPFQQRFDLVTTFERSVYFGTLICTAISTLLLIAPTAFHRLTFHRHQRPRLLRLANRFTIAGLLFLALAVCGAVTLITDFLYGSPTATLVAGVVSVVAFTLFWVVIPLVYRRHGP
ncbi:MAG: hypothetical protein J0H98_09905 [Solirubrobacterales bacterium]|nr:hypothetical protein [Solirubrobacterales bacterium]